MAHGLETLLAGERSCRRVCYHLEIRDHPDAIVPWFQLWKLLTYEYVVVGEISWGNKQGGWAKACCWVRQRWKSSWRFSVAPAGLVMFGARSASPWHVIWRGPLKKLEKMHVKITLSLPDAGYWHKQVRLFSPSLALFARFVLRKCWARELRRGENKHMH